MPQQPELNSSTPVARQVPQKDTTAGPQLAIQQMQAPDRIPRWLVRGELIIRVLLRVYIGLAVCVAPWFKLFWERNPLFVTFPTLSIYAAHGAVRGLISGIGLLNIWIAFHELMNAENFDDVVDKDRKK